jgi:DNA repair exonuclease SbcCD nuclease subunit
MSSIRILHTADNHIGLGFTSRGYTDRLRQQLVEERFLALGRVVDAANRRSAHFLVVAGDLFDRLDVQRKDVERAAAVLNGFAGLHVLVLPGNHDFYDTPRSKLWEWFTGAMDEHRLVFLAAPEAVTLRAEEREVTFFPGPCTSKTSAQNAIAWVAAAEKNPQAVNIGVAHGSVNGISPDTEDRYFQMTPSELGASGVDFWLLGHTHLRYPAASRVSGATFFIPSTHTPDGFDCDHEGYVWYLEVDDVRRISAESLRTGAFRFLRWERDIRSTEALDALEQELRPLDSARTCLKLALRGRLSAEGIARIAALKNEMAEHLAHAEISDSEVGLNIDRVYIDRTFSAGSLPHRLLMALAENPADDLALQLAHDLVREAGR